MLCTGNSARSQMGGLFRREGGGKYEVQSAGTKPSSVRPEAISVMKEIGIDISGHRYNRGDQRELNSDERSAMRERRPSGGAAIRRAAESSTLRCA